MKLESSSVKIFLVFIPIGLYLVVLPAVQAQPNGIEGLYNTKRIFQLGLFFYFLLQVFIFKNYIFNISKLVQRIPKNIRIGLILLFLLGIISTLFAVHVEWALLELSFMVSIFLLTIIVASLLQDNVDLSVKFFKIIIVIAVSIYLIKFFVGYLMYHLINYPLWGGEREFVGLTGFTSKRHFNHVQTWTLPVLISIIWTQKSIYLKASLLVITGLWGMLLIASAARGTFAAVTISLIIVILLFPAMRKNFLKYSIISAFLATLFYFFFYELLIDVDTESVVDRFSNKGVGGRMEEWISLIPEIIQNPFLGLGPMHYSAIEMNNSWGHPHNWLLQFIYEWGIPAGIIALGITCIGFHSLFSRVKDDMFLNENCFRRSFGVTIFWALLASFIHAFVSGNFVTPVSQVWFILTVGIAIAYYYDQDKEGNYNKNSDKIIYILILISLVGYVSWGAQHGFQSDNYSKSYTELYNTNIFHPRFWQQGKIGFEQ